MAATKRRQQDEGYSEEGDVGVVVGPSDHDLMKILVVHVLDLSNFHAGSTYTFKFVFGVCLRILSFVLRRDLRVGRLYMCLRAA